MHVFETMSDYWFSFNIYEACLSVFNRIWKKVNEDLTKLRLILINLLRSILSNGYYVV